MYSNKSDMMQQNAFQEHSAEDGLPLAKRICLSLSRTEDTQSIPGRRFLETPVQDELLQNDSSPHASETNTEDAFNILSQKDWRSSDDEGTRKNAAAKIDVIIQDCDISKISLWSPNDSKTYENARLKRTFGSLTLHNSRHEHISFLPSDISQTLGVLLSKYQVTIDPFLTNFGISAEQIQTGSSEICACFVVYACTLKAEEIGHFLSNQNIHLQRPLEVRKKCCYKNPQSYQIPKDIQIQLEHEIELETKEAFIQVNNEIDSIFTTDTRIDTFSPVNISPRIITPLLEHQRIGVTWMLHIESNSTRHCNGPEGYHLDKDIPHKPTVSCNGGIIADEMGLGKSLTCLATIATSLDLNEEDSPRTTLLIVPKSTLTSWSEQINRHTTSLHVLFYHNRSTKRHKFTDYDLVLTTYSVVTNEEKGKASLDTIAHTQWRRIILDEAHVIRNRNASSTKYIGRLNAQSRWCVTGTVVQNQIDDFGSLLEFLRAEPVQDRKSFLNNIINPLKNHQPGATDNLRSLVAATTLRRSKKSMKEHGLELPPRNDTIVRVELSSTERNIYSSVQSATKRIINDLLNSGSQDSRVATQYLVRLRQACNSPMLLPSHFMDASRLEEHSLEQSILSALSSSNICEKCATEIGTQSQIASLSSCQHTLCKVCMASHEQCPVCVPAEELEMDGVDEIVPQEPQIRPNNGGLRSSKLTILLHNLKRNTEHAQPVKSVVFACWTSMLDLIAQAMDEEGLSYTKLTGSMSTDQRHKSIQQFRTDASMCAILVTLGSGSVGIDLTVASEVHLVEPQFNPMVEEQALARIHRIGQTRPVTTIRYVVKNTYEEQIQAMQNKKLQLAELFAGVEKGREKLLKLKDLLK